MKVSIIVPIYNGEKFIKRCIDSILSQTYSDIEILLINDGSTDDTKKILDEISVNKKIKIFNNENHGVSYSRNFGIEKAIGDYIMFVDVDDILLENAVEELVRFVENNTDVDIIRFNGYEELKDGKLKDLPFKIQDNEFKVLSETEKINLFIGSSNTLRCYSWLLFMKKSKINKFRENLAYLEDTLFYLENFIDKDKKIYFLDEKLYIYKVNNNSVTKEKQNYYKKIAMMIDSYKEISKFTSNYNFEKNLVNCWILRLIMYRIEYLASACKRQEFIQNVKDIKNNTELNSIISCTNIKYLYKIKRIEWLFFKINFYSCIYYINRIKNKIKVHGG